MHLKLIVMKTAMIILGLLFLLISCKNDSTVVLPDSTKDSEYKNWPGKDGIIKCNIEFPAQLITKYQLSLTVGSNGQSFFYKIPIDENDTIKKGKLQVGVFSNIEAAQLGLVSCIAELTTPFKPPFLTNEEYKAGEVAFGEVKNSILWMAFVRNNVLIIIDAPVKTAKEISFEIDKSIINASNWKEGMAPPSFLLPD